MGPGTTQGEFPNSRGKKKKVSAFEFEKLLLFALN